MERLGFGPAATRAHLGMRLVSAGLLGLGLSIGLAVAAIGADLDGNGGPKDARRVPAASTEADDWQRSDGKEQDLVSSDGYGTGFVIYVLRRQGVPTDSPQIQRGVTGGC